MLSLLELRRVAEVLAARQGARLERAVQDAPDSLVLTLAGGGDRAGRERLQLRLAASRSAARASALPASPKAPPEPPAFAAWVRAHAAGGRLAVARLAGGERQLVLRFEGPAGVAELLLSVLGPRSNLYGIDAEGVVRASLRPLDATRRDLSLGEPWRDPPGSPPGEGADRFAEHEGEALLDAIERLYAARESEAEHDDLARRLRQALKKQGASIARKEAALGRDLEAGARADDYGRQGELLKSALGRVRPGADAIEIADFETGEPVRIELDPTLDAKGNLERLFKRQRKTRRGAERAQVELGVLAGRREAHEALRAAFEAALAAQDPAALEAFAAEPEPGRLLERFFPAPSPPPAPRPRIGKRELPRRLLPKRYRTSDELEVWVGKNDEGNDLLTTRLANGRDLFFHLEGSPGSHVVLRTGGRDEPPQASLLEAAELAVHFSKQRELRRARVHVASIKDISKPRGTKPGLVYVHRGRSLDLRRDAARLKRILGARLDD